MEPFEYCRPSSVKKVLNVLKDDPRAKLIAGGTDLVDHLKLGVETPSKLVDISSLQLGEIELKSDALLIGALATSSQVAAHHLVLRNAPAVAQALLAGASGQIRNAATIGGNLLQRTRCPYFRSADWRCNKRVLGTGCAAIEAVSDGHALLGTSEACIAVNPSDLAVALLAADTHVHLASFSGERKVPIAEFYRRPGETPHIETAIAADELITKIEVPLARLGQTSRYLKLRGRASFEFATVSVASAMTFEGDTVTAAAVALGGLGTIPWRVKAAENLLLGHPLTKRRVNDFCDALFSGAVVRRGASKLALARGAIHRALLRGAA